MKDELTAELIAWNLGTNKRDTEDDMQDQLEEILARHASKPTEDGATCKMMGVSGAQPLRQPKQGAVPVNLSKLKTWVMEERDDHAINDALFDGFIVALCNKIDELTVKQEAQCGREKD